MVRKSIDENDELTYFDTDQRKSKKNMEKRTSSIETTAAVAVTTTTTTTTMPSAEMATTSNPYQLKFDKTSTLVSNASRKTAHSDNASDIVDADYVDKNVPKMELLKINYVSRGRNNNLAQIDKDNNDSIASVQLRAKKRNHSKQQLYQRSHSDGLLKVSELAKLSNCNAINNSNNMEFLDGSAKKSTDLRPPSLSSSRSSITQSSLSIGTATTTTTTATTTTGHRSITPKTQPMHITTNSNGHPQNPLKYTVYKRHNSSDTVAAMKSEKLQYTNDDAIFKNAKKKLSMFDGKKRNSIDTIQFYFDSKSYERHVDNKMYGILMSNCNEMVGNQQQQQQQQQQTPATKLTSVKRLAPSAPPPPPPSAYENKSNSWNFVKATKSLLNGTNIGRMASGQKYTKNVPATKKLASRDSSLMDLTRIGQLFRETRRASADDLLDGGRMFNTDDFKPRTTISETDYENKTASTAKKVKTLSAEFENKCLCDGRPRYERKQSAPAHLISDTRCGFSENCAKLRRRFEYPLVMADMSRSPSPPPTLPPKNVSQLVKQFGSRDDEASGDKRLLYLLKKTRSKSISSIENERKKLATFGAENISFVGGHLHQANCLAAGKTCGYKNCTFTDCPMSSITAALSNVNRKNYDKKLMAKTHINGGNHEPPSPPPFKSNINDDDNNKQMPTSKCPNNFNNNNISITKIDTISNKSKLYLKTKDFMDNDDDDDKNFIKEFEMSPNKNGITLSNKLKNLINTPMTNVNVMERNSVGNDPHLGTTIPIKFAPNQQNLNNSMKCKSVEKLDFNSTSHIENQKFNTNNNTNNTNNNSNIFVLPEMCAFSKNEDDNRVKIFIRNPAPPAIDYPTSNSTSPIYGRTSSAESIESDYYDSMMGDCEITQDFSKKFEHFRIDDDNDDNNNKAIDVPEPDDKCNINNFDIKPTTNLLQPIALKHSATIDLMHSKKNLSNMFPSRLGCDGAIFWNDCYYYDEHGGCECCNKSNDMCTCAMPIKSRCSENEPASSSGGGGGGGDIDDDDDDDDDLDDCYDEKQIDGSSSRPQSMEGPMDSGISLNGDTISSPDSDNSSQHHMQNQNDIEAKKDFRSKRCHVLTELLETERIYVAEMGSILRGYRDQIHSEEMASLVPPGLHGKEDILFGNLNELYTFHSEVFLKDLENCISTTELVALCFVQRRDTFYRLYSFYCQNIPRSERLRETLVDTHLFLQECQKRLGHKLPLAAYLLKPVQRITKYQLLLKDLLRFSDNGTCAKELQKALDCMLIVLKCVNDSMHQIAITGFPADLTQQGELLLQDSFQLWTESKKDIRLRLKTQQRHIFLYQKAMLFCKQASKMGHNKSTYQFKHYVKMSQIGLTESVRGDPKRFEIWLQGRSEVHTIQAMTVDIKNKWVAEIKKVLLNQLEELKDENFKQYGLRSLRQTVSWDTPTSLTGNGQRALSIDTNSTNSNETNRCSNISDESGPITTAAPISSSSSEHDNHEAGAWSSDYSNSEDEYPNGEDTAPGNRFVSLADYCAMGHSEVSMKEGDTVELLKIGCAGWWYVKIISNNAEGWAPAAFLDPINRRTQRSNSKQIEQN